MTIGFINIVLFDAPETENDTLQNMRISDFLLEDLFITETVLTPFNLRIILTNPQR